MTRDDVARWLDRYIDAWRTYDRDAIRALFTADAEYRYHPWDEPVRGADAIADDWLDDKRHRRDVRRRLRAVRRRRQPRRRARHERLHGRGRRGQPALPQRVLHRVRRRRRVPFASPRSSSSSPSGARAPREGSRGRPPGMTGRPAAGHHRSMHSSVRHLLPTRIVAALVALAAVAGPLAPPGGRPGASRAGDTVPPVVTAPVAAPAAGEQAATAAVPLRVTWTAKDPGGSGVVATRLQVRIDGGSWTKVALGRAGRAPGRRLRPPAPRRAVPCPGHRRRRQPKPLVRQRPAPGRAPLGGRAERGRRPAAGRSSRPRPTSATAHGAPARPARSSRSRSPAARSPGSGGGRRTAAPRGSCSTGWSGITVSTNAATRSDRRILYVATWPDAGEHTITIRALGTAGHPDVVVDGFVVGDAPPADPVLVGAGDVATCGDPGDNRTAELLDAIPGRVFVAGDIAYPGRHRGPAAGLLRPDVGPLARPDLARDRQPRVQHERRPPLLGLLRRPRRDPGQGLVRRGPGHMAGLLAEQQL